MTDENSKTYIPQLTETYAFIYPYMVLLSM